MVEQDNDQLLSDLRIYLAQVADVQMPAVIGATAGHSRVGGASKPRFSWVGRVTAGVAAAAVMAGILATSLAIHRSLEPQQMSRPKTGLTGYLYFEGSEGGYMNALKRIDLSNLRVETVIRQTFDPVHPTPHPDGNDINGAGAWQSGGNVYVGVSHGYRSSFLTKLEGHQLVPVPGLGEPNFISFEAAPDGVLTWTAYKDPDFGTDRTMELHVWNPSTRHQRVVLTSTSELISPTVGPDGSVAVLQSEERYSALHPKLLVIRPDGIQLQYQLEEANSIRWGPKSLLLVGHTNPGDGTGPPNAISLLNPTTGAVVGAIPGWMGADLLPDRETLLLRRLVGHELEIGVSSAPDYSSVRSVGRIPKLF